MTARSLALPSWNDGEAKTAIPDFVRRVSNIRGADYVPPTERIAVFDREFKLSPLAEALDKAESCGLTVVSMKRDWSTVFSANAAAAGAKRKPAREAAH